MRRDCYGGDDGGPVFGFSELSVNLSEEMKKDRSGYNLAKSYLREQRYGEDGCNLHFEIWL